MCNPNIFLADLVLTISNEILNIALIAYVTVFIVVLFLIMRFKFLSLTAVAKHALTPDSWKNLVKPCV